MNTGHGGNLLALAAASGRPEEEILDFSANINPIGPPPWLRQVISAHVSDLVHYPEPDAAGLVQAAAERYGVPPERVIAGNGTSHLLYALPRALDAKRAIIPSPAYIDYQRAAELAGLEVMTPLLKEEEDFCFSPDLIEEDLRPGDAVFLGHPNNPTGAFTPPAELKSLIAKHPEVLFILDEAFADFLDKGVSLAKEGLPNTVILCSLTKFYAVPGLRLGIALAPESIADHLRRQIAPWSVNTLAEAVGIRALADEEYGVRTRSETRRLRRDLVSRLDAFGCFRIFPSAANYLLLKSKRKDFPASRLAEELLRGRGIALRVCDNYQGLDKRFFRVAVRSQDENERLASALQEVLKPASVPSSTARKQPKPCLMLQGTASNAGKSVLAAAFCRILLQDGYDVAPFKAQNMALNSFVTRNGLEMGRAQVVQAEAARLAPDVRMNPILLKPSSDTGSQIIRMGKPVGNMDVSGYDAYKRDAFVAVREAYDSLSAEHEVIVLEGAGSPGEVNLKARDITNMRMAEYAKSPVLLVGDIDRGGVYAAFVGTMEVLEEWERRLIRGFVVNRFRGDPSLLGPAHEYVQTTTRRPVLGVIPYLQNLGLPEEDSVTFKAGGLDQPQGEGNKSGGVDIALIDLPHISNFTDVDPLRLEPDVHLRTVRNCDDLGKPDALILPGSKNVIADLESLKQNGLISAIMEMTGQKRCVVVGLCAGFQMLGTTIRDPHQIESARDRIQGLGLLPMSTVLAQEKTLTQVRGMHSPSGLALRGYEIHHGQATITGSLEEVVVRNDKVAIGYSHSSGLVWGTYLHGLFDEDAFRRWFVDDLRTRKGLPPLNQVQANYDIHNALDRLAEVVRQNVDLAQIYRLMGIA